MRYVKQNKNLLTFSDINTNIDISLNDGWETDMINKQYDFLSGDKEYVDKNTHIISNVRANVGSPTRELTKKRYKGTDDFIEQ